MRACTKLRHLICGGEALPPPVAARFQQVLANAHLHNLYGPTEATVACTGADHLCFGTSMFANQLQVPSAVAGPVQ